ncbi:hypothetical protein [Alkalinema sp. FACHB-956]|uniref:hypothetical protein n=1 Tax=Alkalinema sp. FACHB-956 TaxID=2692768 RepID=UPI001687A0C9|nr:hypothetical protein [Alkalinema sp. FACHB-956]MBD2327206.1 hypothetical protein [Alkalinema sp. FACHB-956]
MRSPQSPKTVRYWQARLRSLRDPRVWGTAIAVGLAATFGWIAWQNPETLEFSQSPRSETDSEQPMTDAGETEDLAIGADIDNLSVLFNQVNNPNAPTLNLLQPPKKAANAPQPSSDSEISSTLSLLAAVSPPPKNPSQAELNMSQLALLGSLPGDRTRPAARDGLTGRPVLDMSIVPGQNSFAPLGSLIVPSSGNPPQNVLADALSRYTNSPNQGSPSAPASASFYNPSNPSFAGNAITNPPIEGIRPFSGTALPTNSPLQGTTGIPATPYPANAYTQVLQQAPATGLDPRSPAFGVPGIPTGAVPNSAIETGAGIGSPSSGSNPTGINPGGMNQTVLPGVAGATSNQPQFGGIPPTESFTTPRMTPGRYIGGGRINTFSNP